MHCSHTRYRHRSQSAQCRYRHRSEAPNTIVPGRPGANLQRQVVAALAQRRWCLACCQHGPEPLGVAAGSQAAWSGAAFATGVGTTMQRHETYSTPLPCSRRNGERCSVLASPWLWRRSTPDRWLARAGNRRLTSLALAGRSWLYALEYWGLVPSGLV